LKSESRSPHVAASLPPFAKLYDSTLKKSPKSHTRLLRLDTTILVAAISATIFVSAAEYRVWQDVNGRKVEAVFKGIEGDQVNLGLEDGKVLPFPLEKLSPADRKWVAEATAPVSADLHLPENINIILEDRCQDCHEDGTEKGDIRLDNLADLSLDARLELMNRMQEQVYLGQMPPKKKSQPTEAERTDLVKWLGLELGKHNASKLEDKLRYPDYGNYVDHKKLFSGEIKEKAYTPARRWLVSPQIFTGRVADVFKLEGRDRDNAMRGLYGVTNPFVLPDHAGVRDYDISALDGGHLLVMLTNANWISEKQIRPALVSKGLIGANDFPNPKDKWSPRDTPEAFRTVIMKESMPTDDEIMAAIRAQFDCVLQREPSGEELDKYLGLTRSSIELGGNTEGLRQMLITVMLESEFLYRLEFGDGTEDADGRQMLSPREASYAIAYALGDSGPDAALREAAANGKLSTKEDFKREVMRLLTPGKAHPRALEFFRDFFGYPLAVKVFKDPERIGGIFENPGRGTFATPGFLVEEADRVVAFNLAKDKNVFENLLTTDEYYVYHDKDNQTGRQVIDEWKEVWEKLKDTDWKNQPEKVLADNAAVFEGNKWFRLPSGGHGIRDFLWQMYFFSDYFGKGITPFTTIATAHGYRYNHSPIYNLPPTPLRGRYGAVQNKNFTSLDDTKFWDYPVEQPFKVENRMGILTHPAWLIAFSQNAATDPIHRGRWVREMLLAGRVPDVPITVDAQIPEDPHKTLRGRLDSVTTAPECWKCHEYMNPLGLAFEEYDDFGRFRVDEALEHPDNLLTKGNGYVAATYKMAAVDSTGSLDGTDDPSLDGEVTGALDLVGRLAKSSRVRQSIIRHAFRFFMGRNELLSDSQTLIDADKAYVDSGGSFNAVIVSLLTSDSFIYRKQTAQ
jgi:hypothetical protein